MVIRDRLEACPTGIFSTFNLSSTASFRLRTRKVVFAHAGLALAVVLLAAGIVANAAEKLVPKVNLATLVVQDLSGRSVKPLADEGQKATVLFFVMHECPVANAYAPEIARIMKEYETRGVRSHVVYVEADLPAEKARDHARDFGFKAGTLRDPSHLLSRAIGATVSPEAAVVSPTGEVLYLGRIDDRVSDFGRRRVEPTRRDLRLTLDAVLAGQPVPARTTKAIGCYIPEDHTKTAQH